MDIKVPKSDKYQWTQHSLFKMRQYGLSPQRIIRVIRNPERIEEGIVEKTIAVMQPASVKYKNFKKTWSQEIWAMYQNPVTRNSKPVTQDLKNPLPALRATLSQIGRGELGGKIKIISAWRYPGVSPKNNPIPDEILEEIQNAM
jgi:hypothetical protein